MSSAKLIENVLSVHSLKDCPVRITSSSEEKIESLTKQASLKSFEYEPIKVAAVNVQTKGSIETSFYVVDGHDLVQVFRENKTESIRCRIYQVDSVSEALILHITLHQQNVINPMKLLEASDYLRSKGIEGRALEKALLLTSQQKQMLRCKFSTRVKELLNGYLEELSGTYGSVLAYPYYLLIRIGKIPEDSQEQAMRNIINKIDLTVPAHKFSFPSVGQLDVLVSDAKIPKESAPKTIVFEIPDKSENSKSQLPVQVESTKKLDGDAKKLLASHEMMMQCTCETKYIIDTKKHTISPMDENNSSGVVVIKGDIAKPVGIITSDVIEKLGLDNSEKIHTKVIDQKGLQKIVEKPHSKSTKFFIISSEKL